MNKLMLFEAVAEAWELVGLNYAVLHGLERYPDAAGRDLDVLVPADRVERAITIARQVFEERGLTVARPSNLWGARLLATENALADDVLELHIVSALTWWNVALLRELTSGERLGPFRVDHWASFVKRIVMPVLSGESRKFLATPAPLQIHRSELEVAAERLPTMLGAHLATHLLDAVAARDVARLQRLTPRLRRHLILKELSRHPGGSLMLLARATWRKLRLPFTPCGPIVVICGGEKEQRQNLIRAISQGELFVFTRCVIRDRGMSVERGGARAQANVGITNSFHRLRSALHQIIAAVALDRVDSSRQRLVLYNGHVPEGLDSRTSPWVRSAVFFLSRVLVRPDLIVLLVNAHSELRRKHGRILHNGGFLGRHPRLERIMVDRPVEELRRHVMHLLLEVFVAKQRRSS